MLSNIKGALTRKFGPLPAWAWFTIAAAGLYFYRQRSGGSATTNNTGTPVDNATAATPQDPLVLQPGESAYDPGTGSLVTAPGTPTDTTAVAPVDPGASDTPPVDTTTSDSDVEPTATVATPSAKARTSSVARAAAAVVTGKIGPVNTARLRKEGYSQAEIDYHVKRKTPLPSKPIVHKRTAKAKTGIKSVTKKVTTHVTSKTKARSKATVKHPVPRPKTPPKPVMVKPRTIKSAPKPAPRKVAKTPPKPVIRQRPAPAQTTKRKKK